MNSVDAGNVTENLMAEYLKSKAIKEISVIENENGKYLIGITVTWKKGEMRLVTARKKPKEWVSLDRLARHLKKLDGDLPSIVLTLNKNAKTSTTTENVEDEN